MYLILKIEDFEKIRIDDFCKENDFQQEMIVEGTGIIIEIKSENTELMIKIVKGSDKPEPFEGKLLEEILTPYYSSIECEINSENDMVLALKLALFISRYTNMVLYDGYESYITGDRLQDMNDEEIQMLIEESKIHLKYYEKTVRIKEKIRNTDIIAFKKPYVISLILSSILVALLIVYMILVMKVENGILIALPIILVVTAHLIIPIMNIITVDKYNKKLWQTSYDKVLELSALHNAKAPKKPSINKKQKNNKQTIINIFGISIIPGIILGSILIAFDQILLGLFIIILPWILLIMTKILVTDKETKEIEKVVLELTKKLWKKEDDYIGIKYQITEKRNYNWCIEIGTYKELDIETVNSLNTSNTLITDKELMGVAKCNSTWEDVQNIVESVIIHKIISTEEFQKKENVRAITVGFKDGREGLVYKRNETEE